MMDTGTTHEETRVIADDARHSIVDIESVSKTFVRKGRSVQALGEVDLTIEDGEFVTFLGPSGCGKSTLLHIIGGFEQPSGGQVLLDGDPVTSPTRRLGMVFQHATLFPWKTIAANVAWPLRTAGTSQRDALRQAQELIDLVGLHGFENAYPNELSGGMRQRAALARTLIMQPRVLLMDEPFGALDAQTREVMQEELNRIWTQRRLTVVFVTHDINEAVFLGDRVVVMGARPGRIVHTRRIELGRPRGAETKKDSRMVEYHNELWDVLREQSNQSLSGQGAGS